MKTFGTDEILWPGNDGFDHVIVATKGSAWEHLCHAESEWVPARPRTVYETVEKDSKPTRNPWVWKHDRSKVTCEHCVAALERLDPGFNPSDVDLLGSFPPLCGTMGRTEAELAAALIVRVCQVREDAWQDVDVVALGTVINDDLLAGREPLRSMNSNPFCRPDAYDLVKRGCAEWIGEPGTMLVLTSKGLQSLRKWVRK